MRYLHKLFAMMLSVTVFASCLSVPAKAADDTSAVQGTYTSDDLTLVLGTDGTFTLSDTAEMQVSGTFTYEVKSGWGGPSTNVTLDETSMGALQAVMPWYSYIKLGSDTFTITRDVSKALVSNGDIQCVTVPNEASKTGYTTMFTVADHGYKNLYAYGDWIAAYKTLTDPSDPSSYSTERYTPDQWENGMDYCTSSAMPMTQNEDGSWTLTLDLASSVMGIACYHDVEETDMQGALFPQKKTFNIPYDAQKQSKSTNWSVTFSATENGNAAGNVSTAVTDGGINLDIYTPAGYSDGQKYPVLYLIAGGGSTYESWFTQGMAGNIFDNLSAEGKVEPTVIVAMEFKSVTENQLQDDVIPYVEAHYSVYNDAEHRALGAVSMGSVTATGIWMKQPELFTSYAFLSGANKSIFTDPSSGEQPDADTVEKMKEASYFIGGGTTDFNMFTGDSNSASITQLDAWMDYNGIAHNLKGDGNYEVVMGDHNWPIWAQLLIPYATDYLWKTGSEGEGDEDQPQLKVTSDILGLADTGNKSTLKQTLISTGGPGDTALYYYNEEGKRVKYEDQSETHEMDPVKYQGKAVLDLGDDVDDSLIDSSKATVKLVDGNGYYADELIFNGANTLNGTWKDGKLTYTLPETGAFEWNNWDYYDGANEDEIDTNSGREWSMMGGDGNGVYFFNLEVSGILYNGQEIPEAKIPVAVYIYGRSSADLGLGTEFVENTYDSGYTSGLAQGEDVQWKWHSDNAEAYEPFMNDKYSDYFSIVWPAGTNASDITADDVTVTLRSAYGDEYVLSTETDYGEHEYAVLANGSETEVVVTYQQWAYVPVYSTMEITVDNGTLQASKTFDISSVGTYLVQTGGGGKTVDHTVTAYNHYGIGGMTLENAADTTYTLSVKMDDGSVKYYAEDANGNGYLADAVETPNPWGSGTTSSAPDEAWKGDATEKYHIAVRGNVVYAESRDDNTEVKTVDGKEITFTQNVNVVKSDAEILAGEGTYLEPGYNQVNTGADKWAWTFRYQSGWTTASAKPDSLPYVEGAYPYGYTADTPEESRPYYGMEIPSGPTEPSEPGVPGEKPGEQPTDSGTQKPGSEEQGGGKQNPSSENPKNDGSDNTAAITDNNPTTVASKTVRTGDTGQIQVWMILLVVAGAVGIGAVVYRKRRS